MKKFLLIYVASAMTLLSLPAFSQAKEDTALLGMAGDNLDLYAVLDLFQKSKTIEAFEKSLNDADTKLNNLDLDLNKKVDFIKVVTKKNGDSYQFILQVDVTKTETQDVAVILLDKDKNQKISLQVVGDEELYGKDYVIEPKGNSSITANPGYVGPDPVTKDVPASTTTTVVVQSAPIVQYVYSPAYVPYAPPYYYGFYPPYFAMGATIAVGIYAANHWHHHGGYYGGHYGGNNNVIINNGDNFNNYNNNKMRSNTVSDNRARGNYGDGSGNRGGNRGSGASASTRPSAGTSDRGANRGSGPSASTRPSAGTSDRAGGNRASSSTRQSPSASTRQSSGYSSPSSRSSSMGGGRSMGGGGYRGGGGGGGGRRR
jgi:hypothetical protein